MALEIVEGCVNCWACLPLCPNEAIVEAHPHFLIEPSLCSECVEAFATPQCAAICPVEGVIIDELGQALNPPGSLGGIIAGLPAPAANPQVGA
ncbi:ferredoxin [Uliginosibacterium sp. 31-16]|uniref:ferredoxin n=1 Tax=Uliginosibacterium sp. 31-16 TaxID=3068315 RepID=UPI00273EA781|nr:ferredoxin [Uliginosibacterium sp. 31-16]MDP5238022.1 ferredoxin [Uliginosibacterium sp. 31-16]